MAKHEMYANATPHTQTNEPVEKLGIVTNCSRLNVRKKPNKEAKILAVIDEGTELTVNLSRSTRNWYSVSLESGLYGYCMTEYIDIE